MSENTKEHIFKSFFKTEYPGLCRYAQTYLSDDSLAEDIVQNTFIKVWEQKHELIGSEQLKYYMVTAVRNNCISEIRKNKKISYTEESSYDTPEPFFSNLLAKEELTEQQARISNALDLLPPKCREVFLLIKLHGMSYKQAAATMDISVKTVENQMGKALSIFRSICVACMVCLYNFFVSNI